MNRSDKPMLQENFNIVTNSIVNIIAASVRSS